MGEQDSNLTQLLHAATDGDAGAAAELLPLVYQELRALAQAEMARLAPGQTLQATALVHEAWLRLAQSSGANWKSRAHFFYAAAQAIRQIVIDQIRRRGALKRGGDLIRVNLDHVDVAVNAPSDDVLALDEALNDLARTDERAATIVTLRYFGGVTFDGVAELLGLSKRTVEREWEFARTWLYARISAEC
ncbi:MAG: sigma-70 family RNA polymerase sigma factor [Phycisphaerae bacterium]|nr:ECF-type sigma factor [Phycisphaerae bacterium]NUQ48150.1 sigma-70 family RNA polymerase sigma factor [Phycisphaerae bacterium]